MVSKATKKNLGAGQREALLEKLRARFEVRFYSRVLGTGEMRW